MSGLVNRVRTDPEFFLAVQQGLIPGMSLITKFGENEAVSTNGEDIWNNPDNDLKYLFPDNAGVTIQVNSNDANDTILGTGARTVEIFGLSGTDFLLQKETLEFDGANFVDSTLTYSRFFRGVVRSAGSAEENLGTIRFQNGDTLEAIGGIQVDENQTEMAIFTIPGDKTGYLFDYWIAVGSGRTSEIDLRIRPFGEVFQLKHHLTEVDTFTRFPFMAPLRLSPKTDVKLRGQSNQATHHISAGFTILMVDDLI